MRWDGRLWDEMVNDEMVDGETDEMVVRSIFNFVGWLWWSWLSCHQHLRWEIVRWDCEMVDHEMVDYEMGWLMMIFMISSYLSSTMSCHLHHIISIGRSGISQLTIIDFDIISLSTLSRWDEKRWWWDGRWFCETDICQYHLISLTIYHPIISLSVSQSTISFSSSRHSFAKLKHVGRSKVREEMIDEWDDRWDEMVDCETDIRWDGRRDGRWWEIVRWDNYFLPSMITSQSKIKKVEVIKEEMREINPNCQISFERWWDSRLLDR